MPSLNTGNAILSNAIAVDSSYNVGIGGAASGTNKLQVTGIASANSFIPTSSTIPSNGMYLSAANTLAFATNTGNRLTISSTGAATFSSSVTAAGGNSPTLGFQLTTTTSTSTPRITSDSTNATVIRTGASGAPVVINNFANSAELVRFADGGNVGIGDNNPGELLVLKKATYPTIKLIETTDTASGYFQYHSDTNEFRLVAISNHPLIFSTNDTHRMRITASGELLIGKTSGTGQKLEVNGGIFLSTSILVDGTNIQYRRHGSSDGIELTAGPGGVYLDYGMTSWGSLSDERFKNIDSEILNATESLMTLRAVKYSLKDDKRNKINLGLIAQDVVKVFPEAVDIQNNEIGTMGVRYTELIPVLVKAIQEQTQIIKDLEARIVSLESK
jgi:hypothetical protein